MRAAAFSVLFNLGSVHTRWAFDEPWASAGSERDRTDAQRGHRISSRSQAGTVFNIELFTTTLPVCAFHSHLNTKAVSQDRVLLKGVSSAEFSFSVFLCKEKKKTKKSNTLQVLHKLKLCSNFTIGGLAHKTGRHNHTKLLGFLWKLVCVC